MITLSEFMITTTIICFILCIVITILSNINDTSSTFTIKCMISVLIVIILCIATLICIKHDFYTELTNCIESGYSVYINGVEVEPSKIAIDNYPMDNIEVNDDTNEIYISSISN